MRFPIRKQYDAMDCGPTCLQMIAEYYGQYYSLQTLREKSYLTRNGSSLKGISSAAKSIGFKTGVCMDELGAIDTKYPFTFALSIGTIIIS